MKTGIGYFNAFVEAMKKDRAKNTISHISELGLIQMTRKARHGRVSAEPSANHVRTVKVRVL